MLESTLKGFDPIKHDCSNTEMHHDYEKVGQFGFHHHQLEGVKYPCSDFPSMNRLNITSLKSSEKFINKVRFEQLLAVIPQCNEDTDGAGFEDWIYNFAEQRSLELFVNFPHQIEAFPISFEDPFSVYTLHADNTTGRFKVKKFRQEKSADQFKIYCNIIHSKMNEVGVYCPEFNTLATVSTL